MGKNKQLIMKTITAFAVSSVFITSLSIAQTVASQGSSTTDQTNLPALTVLQYDNQTMLNAGCDPQIMNNLNQTYLNKRGVARNVELNTMVRQQVDNTPLPPKSGSGGSCFQQAASNINGVISTYQNILALLSGSINPGPLLQKAGDMVMNAACQEVNNYTGQATSGVSQSINGGIGGALGQVNNYQVGSGALTMSGGQVLSNVGLNTSNVTGTSGVPYVTSGQITNNVTGIASQVTNCTSLSNCNPFK